MLSDEGGSEPGVDPLPSVGDHALAIFFISAIETGFCSSLTTISSFVNDICNLARSKRYIYALATIICAQIISIIIVAIGTYRFDI